eukprot:scaffold23567_cov52-Attheya_sp.AAC.3
MTDTFPNYNGCNHHRGRCSVCMSPCNICCCNCDGLQPEEKKSRKRGRPKRGSLTYSHTAALVDPHPPKRVSLRKVVADTDTISKSAKNEIETNQNNKEDVLLRAIQDPGTPAIVVKACKIHLHTLNPEYAAAFIEAGPRSLASKTKSQTAVSFVQTWCGSIESTGDILQAFRIDKDKWSHFPSKLTRTNGVNVKKWDVRHISKLLLVCTKKLAWILAPAFPERVLEEMVQIVNSDTTTRDVESSDKI